MAAGRGWPLVAPSQPCMSRPEPRRPRRPACGRLRPGAALGPIGADAAGRDRRHRATSVFWNRCYEPHAIGRAKRIMEALGRDGIQVRRFNASLLFEPRTVQTAQGSPYRAFTPFYRASLTRKVPTHTATSAHTRETARQRPPRGLAPASQARLGRRIARRLDTGRARCAGANYPLFLTPPLPLIRRNVTGPM